MVEELRLRLLGSPAVSLGGRPVTGWVSAKAQALLYYLAVTGRPHSRDALVCLLWGDTPEESARASLRTALSNLHKLLGSHLAATRQTVALDPSAPLAVDATALLALTRTTDGDSPTPRQLREAVDLYGGDFLDGFVVRDASDFDEWAAGQRERLRQAQLRALHELSVHDTARGEYLTAADLLRRLLELDPWREDAHRQLMLTLSYGGQRDAALAQYAACRRVLRDELGEEPEAETMALYERIRAGRAVAPASPATPVTIPVPPTPLLGRDAELVQIARLLEDPECRLLTLLGPGGIGKTRLALQAAREATDLFADGVWFVALAGLRDPEIVPDAIARALDVRLAPGRTVIEALKDWSRKRRALLVLDNFEQVLPATAGVAALLGSGPGLHVLVTSRSALSLRGEHEFQVPPLALPPRERPPEAGSAAHYPSIALFVQRARAGRRGFALTRENAEAVTEICRRLDGLPLAIELAAARAKLMSPHALLRRLENRLATLADGASDLPARQQTLRGTIAWSHDLLAEQARTLFRRLAVFSGGCTLEAIEAVCSDADEDNGDVLPGVTRLCGHSLLQCEEHADGEVRFGMLETIREFALERLSASGEGEALRRAHAEYFLALAEEAEPDLSGAGQAGWLERLETEHDNMRAVLGWSLGGGDRDLGLRLAGALGRFWAIRGHLSEGRRWLELALSGAASDSPRARARALNAAGMLECDLADYERGTRRLRESLALWRALDDPEKMAGALSGLGWAALGQGDCDGAIRLFEEALALRRGLNRDSGIASLLIGLGWAGLDRGDCDAAQQRFEESLRLMRESGDTEGTVGSLDGLGWTLVLQGNPGRAIPMLEESLDLARQLGYTQGVSHCLNTLGMAELHNGNHARATALLEESLALSRELGVEQAIMITLHSMGLAALYGGDPERARALFRESLPLFRAVGDHLGLAYILEGLAGVACLRGENERTVELFGAARAVGMRFALRSRPSSARTTTASSAPRAAASTARSRRRRGAGGSPPRSSGPPRSPPTRWRRRATARRPRRFAPPSARPQATAAPPWPDQGIRRPGNGERIVL